MEQTVTLTREELYELVWSKPMTAIAADFGVSSVAFAKNCRVLAVPTPGRGYWQRLKAGLKPKREILGKPKPGAPPSIRLTKYERLPAATIARHDVPLVVVPERIRTYHPVVKEIDATLGSPRHSEMLVVPGQERSVVRVSAKAKPRALRILHALLEAVDERGHESRLRKLYSKYVLEVLVAGHAIELALHERSHHVVLDQPTGIGPTRQDVPSGRFFLAAGGPFSSFRWSDKKKSRLDDVLGEVILDVEAQAASAKAYSVLYERAEAVRREEQKQRELEERRAAHRRALAEDLRKVAAAWKEVRVLREFVEAAAAAVPEPKRTPEFAAWLSWAVTHAHTVDPLYNPLELAKPLEPDGVRR